MQNKLRLSSPTSGAGYFFLGFELIFQKGLKRFVFIPLIINLLLFSGAFYYLIAQIDDYMAIILDFLPSYLEWLSAILWPLAIITILLSFSFLFSAVANWLAAPFNGLLSEKVERLLSGQQLEEQSLLHVLKDIPRTLSREAQKLMYFLPKAIGFFILYWLLPVAGQIIWFVFLAWSMAIQYKDYPFDNHKISFKEMRSELKSNKSLSYSFGGSVLLFSMIPIINFIVMPVAICGATALWVDIYQKKYL